MLIHKYFILIVFACLSFMQAQTKISGIVQDESGEPLAFTDVYIDGTNYYVVTNDDGSFYLETSEDQTEVKFFQVGYAEVILPLNEKNNFDLVITLYEEEFQGELSEVTAQSKIIYKNKKENPAYQILREVWKRKKSNGLKMFDNYTMEEYEKIEFDLNNLDSTFINRKVFKGLEFVFNNIDTSSITGKNYLPMFLNESLYKIIAKNRPDSKYKKNLIANKTSGFEENEIVGQTVKNLYKDFNVYDNRLNFFNKAFISPLARDGFGYYDYSIIDTLENENQNRVFKIKYYPKRPSELTFKGTFEIVDSIYMVSSVILQSTKGINVNFVRDIYAELYYQNINDSIFVPEGTYIMLDMALVSKKSTEKGVFAHKTNSYKNLRYNLAEIDSLIDQKYDPYSSQAFHRSDDFWKENRHFKLSDDEKDIYSLLDTLKTVKKIKKFANLTEIFGTGYINLFSFWDYGSIYSTFGYNPIEGIRLRGGGRTYFSKNDMWRFAGYLAYGLKDQKIKYGAELRYMFNTHNRFTLGAGYKKDIEQLGAQLTTQEGILTRSFASSGIFSRGDIGSLSWIEKSNLHSSIQVWDDITFRLDGTYQKVSSANPNFKIDFVDQNDQLHTEATNSTLAFSVIAKPGAQYSKYGIDRYEHASLSPLLVGKYTKALKGVMSSEFNYDRVEFLYYHPKLWGSIGRSDIIFEAGKTFGTAPLSFLSVVPGNQSYSIVPSTFAQLNYYEFVTDTYVSLQWDHHFNGRFLSYIPFLKKLNLREVAFIRSVWGQISKKNIDINRSSIVYKAPENKIYYEYGFGLENIGLGNFRFFRIDFNWRGNYKNNPEVAKFGVKFGFDVTF